MAALPQPGLFKAICFVAMLIGTLGLVTSTQLLAVLSRGQVPRLALDFGGRTDRAAEISHKMEDRLSRVLDRHHRAIAGLAVANALLSALLLVSSVAVRFRRTWGHRLMVQASIACAIYELPSLAHQLRQHFEVLRAVERLMPEAYQAALEEPAPPYFVEMSSLLGVAVMVGLALLRLAFYVGTLRYLRRREVRAWFRDSDDD